MSRDVDYTDASTPVGATWLNDVQEVDTGLAWGVRLTRTSTSTLRLEGDPLTEGAYAVRVGAKMRYGTTASTTTASGTAGDYDAYLTSADTDSPKTAAIALVASGASAPVADFTRRIGQITWSGSEITDIRLLNGVQANADQHNSFVLRPLLATATPLTVKGLASQSANLVSVQTSAGANLLSVSTTAIEAGVPINLSNGAAIATSTGTYTGTATVTVRAQSLAVAKTGGGASSLVLYKPDGSTATLSVDNSNQLVIT